MKLGNVVKKLSLVHGAPKTVYVSFSVVSFV